MKIRFGAVTLSSVLFTIALLMMAPAAWGNAMNGWRPNPFDPIDGGIQYRAADSFAPIGFASLAIIVIGLIVAWTGYIRRVRWTWFVMFLIVWAWDFPFSILPSLEGWPHNDIIGSLEYGISEPGMYRKAAEDFLAFLLMLVALNLPLPAFIFGRGSRSGESGCANSGAPDKPTLSEKRQGRWELKIRRDAVTVSCILFTVAVLMLTPAMCRDAATIPESFIRGQLIYINRPTICLAFAGISSLAVILIGLLVTWAGYIKGLRWTWPVMFVIVWVWAFPALILPYLRPWKGEATNAQLFASTISQGGPEWSIKEASLAFLLMVVALILPVKTFFVHRRKERE